MSNVAVGSFEEVAEELNIKPVKALVYHNIDVDLLDSIQNAKFIGQHNIIKFFKNDEEIEELVNNIRVNCENLDDLDNTNYSIIYEVMDKLMEENKIKDLNTYKDDPYFGLEFVDGLVDALEELTPIYKKL